MGCRFEPSAAVKIGAAATGLAGSKGHELSLFFCCVFDVFFCRSVLGWKEVEDRDFDMVPDVPEMMEVSARLLGGVGREFD